MTRFKRIASRGWMGRLLSVLTFGYYPHTDEVSAIADWCVSDVVQHAWQAAQALLHDWALSDATTHAWTLQGAVQHDWGQTDAVLYAWAVADETRDC